MSPLASPSSGCTRERNHYTEGADCSNRRGRPAVSTNAAGRARAAGPSKGHFGPIVVSGAMGGCSQCLPRRYEGLSGGPTLARCHESCPPLLHRHRYAMLFPCQCVTSVVLAMPTVVLTTLGHLWEAGETVFGGQTPWCRRFSLLRGGAKVQPFFLAPRADPTEYRKTGVNWCGAVSVWIGPSGIVSVVASGLLQNTGRH